MQITPLNLDSVLLLLHNSKLAYSNVAQPLYLPFRQCPTSHLKKIRLKKRKLYLLERKHEQGNFFSFFLGDDVRQSSDAV